jgi:ubiquinone/menaquinone biosynthesis C-methylase UbiE
MTPGKRYGEIKSVAQFQQLSLTEWHERYKQQASWSGEVRRYLFNNADIGPESKILEIGSGTGAVQGILSDETDCQLFGIDIDIPSLLFSGEKYPYIHHTAANGFHLPFPKDSFNITYCHYLLLWVRDPLEILIEMTRVTKSDGRVIALAEPDYQARIDHPQPLEELGKKQTESLTAQGIDPIMGRKLPGLFHQAGLKEITAGILGAQWALAKSQIIDENEWMMSQSDLGGKVPDDDLDTYQKIEISARETGKRILFIPTFFAAGIVS